MAKWIGVHEAVKVLQDNAKALQRLARQVEESVPNLRDPNFVPAQSPSAATAEVHTSAISKAQDKLERYASDMVTATQHLLPLVVDIGRAKDSKRRAVKEYTISTNLKHDNRRAMADMRLESRNRKFASVRQLTRDN